jgi:prefoldin subunit 5
MVCKALCVRQTMGDSEIAADLNALEKAIREIERQSGFLEEIKTSSTTIKNGADRILGRIETMKNALRDQVELLDGQAKSLRQHAGPRA